MEYNAKERCCGWCYAMGPTMKCSKCLRAYCCRECQVKDWKEGCHKIWCGKSGEKCIDYEIRDAGEGKGLGLFTLRDFERGEKILVERTVATRRCAILGHIEFSKLQESTTLMKAAMTLAPIGTSSLYEKFVVNCVALSDSDDERDAGSGLFLNFSRVNHDCIGNSNHYYDPSLKLKMLVANHAIPAGSEVTFSYACTVPSLERALRLYVRGFRCTCLACRDPVVGAELDRELQLDQSILQLERMGKVGKAIRAGELLIKVYDKFQASDRTYARTYYDLYQIAIMKKSSVKLGSKYIRQAYTHALRFHGREEYKSVRKYKHFVDNPSAHRNYRIID